MLQMVVGHGVLATGELDRNEDQEGEHFLDVARGHLLEYQKIMGFINGEEDFGATEALLLKLANREPIEIQPAALEPFLLQSAEERRKSVSEATYNEANEHYLKAQAYVMKYQGWSDQKYQRKAATDEQAGRQHKLFDMIANRALLMEAASNGTGRTLMASFCDEKAEDTRIAIHQVYVPQHEVLN